MVAAKTELRAAAQRNLRAIKTKRTGPGAAILLPIFHQMTEAEQVRVVDALQRACAQVLMTVKVEALNPNHDGELKRFLTAWARFLVCTGYHPILSRRDCRWRGPACLSRRPESMVSLSVCCLLLRLSAAAGSVYSSLPSLAPTQVF